MGDDAADGLYGDEAGVFVLINDDALEQRPVEEAAFVGLAFVVKVREIGEDIGDLIQPFSRRCIGGAEIAEAVDDSVEIGADAVLLAFEQIERDRVGVVGLDELESFRFELLLLICQQCPLVIGGCF